MRVDDGTGEDFSQGTSKIRPCAWTEVNTIFTHILVPLDGSKLAECVLPHAVALARVYGASLTVLTVIEPLEEGGEAAIVDPLDWEMRKLEALAYLDGIGEQLQETGLETELSLLEGHAAESIVASAQEKAVDLIVLSSHGKSGLSRWNVSSVAQKVIMDAPASLMIVRAYQSQAGTSMDLTYRRILAPLDGSQRAESVLSSITALVGCYDAHLLLAHVVRLPEMPRNMPLSKEEAELYERITMLNRQAARNYLKQIQVRLSLASEVRLLDQTDAPTDLLALADEEDVDLVVLGAHGYSGNAQRPYGSMATSFITYGSRPLLIVQDLPAMQIGPTPAENAAKEKAGH